MKKLYTIFGLSILFSLALCIPTKAASPYQFIGWNEKELTNSTTDEVYWQSVGFPNMPIRVHIPSATTSVATSSSGMFQWAMIANGWKQRGHYTICGGSSGAQFTSSSWPMYHDSIVWWAVYVKNNALCDEFQIGNELENKVDNVTITYTQFRSLLRSLATDVKTAFAASTSTNPNPKLSYSVAGYCQNANIGITGWINDGTVGGLDYLDHNTYGNVGQSGHAISWCGKPDLAQAVARFGTNVVQVSEFNNDADDTLWNSLDTALQVTQFRQEIEWFKQIGITKAYVYSWRGYLDQDDLFAIARLDGTKKLQWTNLVGPSPITVVQNFGS